MAIASGNLKLQHWRSIAYALGAAFQSESESRVPGPGPASESPGRVVRGTEYVELASDLELEAWPKLELRSESDSLLEIALQHVYGRGRTSSQKLELASDDPAMRSQGEITGRPVQAAAGPRARPPGAQQTRRPAAGTLAGPHHDVPRPRRARSYYG